MSRETNKKFMSAIASAVLSYKRYPTALDYDNVALSVIEKYPFLRSPQGTPQVYFNTNIKQIVVLIGCDCVLS